MANLTEAETYDAGVYQLETVDPVQGGAAGVSNLPLKNLANRTKYLKAHVDSLETQAVGLAPLASPALTGSPTVPTQALGDATTKVATDDFVQKTVGGRLSKSVAGSSNVTLTAVEAGNGILEFTGVLTGSISVIVPTSPTRPWIIKNGTSGAFTVTVKTAAGSGVLVTQGKTSLVYGDGTNVVHAWSDLLAAILAIDGAGSGVDADLLDGQQGAFYAPIASPALTGSPTVPTQALGDNSTKIATDAFVQATVGGRLSKSVAGSSNVTLTAAEAGNGILEFTGALTGSINVIVPTSPTRPWVIKNGTSGAYTVTVKTAAGSGVLVTQGKTSLVYGDGTNVVSSVSDLATLGVLSAADGVLLVGNAADKRDLASPASGNGAALVANAVQRFSSVALMSAMLASTIAVSAEVDGYASSSDGAGGSFYYVPSSAQTVDGVLVFSANGGRWFRNGWTVLGFNGQVDVHWAGAKGDGVTDDFTAIQATIACVKAFNGAMAFHAKNYLCSAELLITGTFRSIHLQGAKTGNHQTASSAGTTIIRAATSNLSALRAEFLVFANENISIDGINFYNPALDQLNGGSAVTVVRGSANGRYISGFRFSNIGAMGFSAAFRFQGLNTVNADNNWIGNVMFENVSSQGCGIGLKLANATLNLVTLSNTLIFDAAYGGIYCTRDGEVGAGTGKGSAFIGTLCNKTHFEGVGGMFRTDPTVVLNSLAEVVRSSLTLIDFTHESCGATIGPVAGEPYQLGVNTDIHVLGSAVDGIAFGEVLLPYLNSTARIWCSSRMRVVANGGRIMSPRGVNAPTLYRTILNGAADTINVPLVESTAFAVKSHLLLSGGQGGYFEAKHNGVHNGAKLNLSTGTAGAGVTVNYNAAADANAVSVTITNASGFTYTAELQVENLSSASITMASEV